MTLVLFTIKSVYNLWEMYSQMTLLSISLIQQLTIKHQVGLPRWSSYQLFNPTATSNINLIEAQYLFCQIPRKHNSFLKYQPLNLQCRIKDLQNSKTLTQIDLGIKSSQIRKSKISIPGPFQPMHRFLLILVLFISLYHPQKIKLREKP